MKNSTEVKLTNGEGTFLLGSIIEDEKGAVHGQDSHGCGYTRCDFGDCDHEEFEMPVGSPRWHDDENAETFWEVK